MKKLLVAAVILVGLLVVAAVVVPRFLDWNAYKSQIAARAERVTGRPVAIGGDIRLTLLPTPALWVQDLRIANVPGGVAADLLRLREAEVEVALLPLLSGRFEVRRVRLVEPVLALEVLPDGGGNWSLAAASTAGGEEGESPTAGRSAIVELPPAKGEADTAADAPAAATAQPSAREAAADLPEVRLDAVEIDDGTIIYRDLGAGRNELIEGLDAVVRAESLRGPVESDGEFRYDGKGLDYDLAVGRLDGDTVPVKLTVSAPAGESSVELAGTVVGLSVAPRFRGAIEAQAADLATAIQAWYREPLPGALAQRAALELELEASAEAADIGGLTLRLGETTAEGAATVRFADKAMVAAQLVAGRIDLDRWLAMPAVAAPGGKGGAEVDAGTPSTPTSPEAAQPVGSQPVGSSPVGSQPVGSSPVGSGDDSGDGGRGAAGTTPAQASASPPAETAAGQGAAPATLPDAVDASVSLSVEAVTFHGGVIRQARGTFELADGRLKVSQLAALLPGGAEAQLSGVLTAGSPSWAFDGSLDAHAADLRGVLRWLEVETAAVPSGPLRTFSVESEIAATPARIEAGDIAMRLDGSRITGQVAVTPPGSSDDPLRLDADLAVDRINLDAYLDASRGAAAGAQGTVAQRREGEAARDRETAAATADEPSSSDGGEGKAPDDRAGGRNNDRTGDGNDGDDGNDGSGGGEPAAAPSLPPVHADVRLRVGSLTYRGVPAQTVVFDGALAPGSVTVRRASIGDVAGASADVSGTLKGLPDAVVMDAVTIEANVPDPHRLARAFAVPAPAALRQLGAVTASGTLAGTADAPTVDLRVQAAGVRLTLDGRVDPPGPALYEGRLGLATGDLRGLLAVAGIDYRPAGPLGATDLAAEVTVGGRGVAARSLEGQLGGTRVDGNLEVTAAGARPKITADLTTGRLVVDTFLPAERAAHLRGRVIPAAWGLPPRKGAGGALAPSLRPAAAGGRWSTETLDLAALRSVDADLALRSDELVVGGYALEGARIDASLEAGVLAVEQLAGRLYGGPTTASGRLDASGEPAFSATVKVDGADLGRAPGARGIATGRLSLETSLHGRGRSEAEIVAGLGGEGSFALRGLNPSRDASGIPVIGPILGSTVELVGAINATLGPVLDAASGRTGSGVADIHGPFAIEAGVAAFDPVAIDSAIYQGRARGTADLPDWRLDMEGEITLAKGVVGELLSGIEELPQACAFSARGPLDRPDVTLASGCLPSKLSIPGGGDIDDVGEALGELLKKRMPSTGDGGPGDSAPPAPAPEEVIKDLFEGFIRR